jgi:DNA polymerase I-like protein with 3'-5' exonuclease and polymerase domains
MSDWQPLPVLPDLRRVGIIALDTETRDNGLLTDHGPGWPWGDGYIAGVSVAYRADGAIQAHYFPIRHPDSPNFDPTNVFQWIRDHAAAGVRFVCQNGLYDFGWLRVDADISMPPSEQLEETQALATMVDENRHHYSLEALCTWRGLPGKDDALLREGCAALGLIPKGNKKFIPQAHIWQLPARYVGRYAEQDPASTLLLFESLDPVLDRENTRGAYRLEVDLLPMVHEMRRRGIRIDTARAEQVRDLMLARRNAVLAQLAEKHGTDLSMTAIRSDKQLAKICDSYGIEYPLTEKGNASFKAGRMGWMDESEHWLPQLVANARRYDNSAKFIESIVDHARNGRVFGEVHPHHSDVGGSRTLRFSYSHPALQQTPKHNAEMAPLIRSIFLPDEGEVWASCDLSQQEFRLIVQYAVRHGLQGAAEMRDQYIRDPRTDIHAAAAERSSGVLDRQGGKSLNFGKFYGMGLRTFAHVIGKPQSEAQKLYDLYDQIMPFVSQLSNMCKQAVWNTGYLTLLDGARMHFNQWAAGGKWKAGAGPCSREEAERRVHDPSHEWHGQRLYRADAHKALNTLIQGSAARYTKMWMREVWRAGVAPILQMHDALDLSVTSPEQAEMVARLGEEAIKLEVPMVVDTRFGRTWADAQHAWSELSAETSPHVEPVEELPDAPARTQHEAPKSINDSDKAPVLPPWEGDENFEMPPAHEIDRSNKLEQDFPHVSETAAAVDPPASGASSGNGQDDGFSGYTRETDHSGSFDSSTADSGRSGNGGWRGSKTEAEEDTYTEEHAGEPFNDTFLRQQCYQLTQVFDYTLADGALLYQQNRYELIKGFTPSRRRPRKRFLVHRKVNGKDLLGAGDRRVPYNWPAIMRAGPGSTIIVAEGEANAKLLIDAGLLATTVLSHKWTPECVAALTGCHCIILEDHDKEGEALSASAQRKLAPVAASTRIVPALHLWKHLPGNREPKPGDDAKDWAALGGDLRKLLDICREIPAEGIIVAAPYEFPAEADIPRWEWLYGRHLLRGEVAGTAAMGGTGKSTSSIVEALAMASGRALLGEEVPRPLRVVLINLEDTRNTMDKRIAAVMRQYNLKPADIGNRLIVKAKGEVKIKVARQRRSGDVERNEATVRALTQLMLEHRGDVLSIDSFIRTHGVNENDNSAIQEVVECYEDVAVTVKGAVHLWHHTRKLGGERATIEAARGASALIDACRSARIFETLTEKEHEQLKQIQPEMQARGFYFRSFNGKRNFAPPADQSDWFEIKNITLLNGDDVGVVTAWRYPGSWDDVPEETTKQVVAEIGRGMPNGQRYSNHNRATTRAAWPIVQRHCPNKTEDQCRRMVAIWIKRRLLYEDKYFDTAHRSEQTGLFTKSVTEEEEDDEAGAH